MVRRACHRRLRCKRKPRCVIKNRAILMSPLVVRSCREGGQRGIHRPTKTRVHCGQTPRGHPATNVLPNTHRKHAGFWFPETEKREGRGFTYGSSSEAQKEENAPKEGEESGRCARRTQIKQFQPAARTRTEEAEEALSVCKHRLRGVARLLRTWHSGRRVPAGSGLDSGRRCSSRDRRRRLENGDSVT